MSTSVNFGVTHADCELTYSFTYLVASNCIVLAEIATEAAITYDKLLVVLHSFLILSRGLFLAIVLENGINHFGAATQMAMMIE